MVAKQVIMNIKFGSDELVNHALNFHWCEMQLTTGLYPYKIEEVYGIVSYQNFQCRLYYTSACEPQVHVWHVCHMWIAQWIKWVNMCGPLQPGIQHSFWHENLCS